ncbi:hypothetical protein FB107DRAFT_225129, partial [Schizophyllum commune]
MRTNTGGKTALILSGKDVNSQDSRDTGKLSPQDAGLDAKSKDLDSRSEAHCQAPAQGDCLCANTGGQTAVSSRDNVKLRHTHSAEEHAPQLFSSNAAAHPEPVSSSSAGTRLALSPAPTGSDVARGSDSRKDSGLMSSVTPTFSPAHVSPDLSCALSRETNAPNLRGVDILASQEAQVRPGSECRGQVLAPSRADAQATAPCAPLAARAINALGARAAEAAVSGEFVAENAVNEERDKAITCRSPADARDLTSVALPCQFGEKAASPDTSSHAHAMVETRAQISLQSSREDGKRSPQSAEHGCDESPARFPDLYNQCRALQASADGLSPSPSTVPCRQAARKPPDKTTLKRSSLHSCEPPLRLRPSTVSSSAPLLRTSHLSTSGRGPNSTNWRARGRPTASPPWEVNALNADLQSKSISECERGLEVSDLQEDVDIESLKASSVKKGLSQSAERSCDESPARFPGLDGQYRALQSSANSPSPSSSMASRHQAARKPPDKTTLKTSSLHRSESGPDSVIWRTRGRLATLLLRKVSTLGVGLRSKSIDERERERASEVSDLEEDVTKFLSASGDEKGSPQDAESDRNVANLHHPRLQASSQASAQGSAHVYAGGQVLASSRRDGNPKSSRVAGKCLPQSAESSTALTVPDRSVCAQAIIKLRTQMSSHSSLDALECSPLLWSSPERDRDENPVQFPDADGQCRPPQASAGGLLPSPSVAPHCHVARETVNETILKGSSLHGSRSTLLTPFATVPLTAPLPSLPSSASPRISEARKPPDKTPDRSSAKNCQPARHGCPASILSAGPPHRLSRRLRYASGPDTAGWRAHRRLVALPLRDMNTPNPDPQISVSSRNNLSSRSTRARKWYSPGLDVADTAAPSAFWHCFHAFERGLVSESPEDSAIYLECVHAGGQAVLSSCKDVKPTDVREGKKDPPQSIASGSKGQRSPSSKLNPATPRTYGRGDFALCCSGSSIGDVGGNGLILRAEKPSRTSSLAEVLDASTTACSSYSDATPQPGGGIGLAVMDEGCDTGYALGFSDNPGELTCTVTSGDASLSDVFGARVFVPSPAFPSTRRVVRQAERRRTTFCLRGSSKELFSANQKAPARLDDRTGPAGGIYARSKRESVHKCCRDVYAGPAEKISAFQAVRDGPRHNEFALCEWRNTLFDDGMLLHLRQSPPSLILMVRSDLVFGNMHIRSFSRSSVLRIECQLPDSCKIFLRNTQSTRWQAYQKFSLELTRLCHLRWDMGVITRGKTETGGPTNCCAR